jgi:hypothetical protein
VANVVWLAIQHQQLFTHHHATKVIKIATNYHKNVGIFYDFSLNKGAFQRIMLGHYSLICNGNFLDLFL